MMSFNLSVFICVLMVLQSGVCLNRRRNHTSTPASISSTEKANDRTFLGKFSTNSIKESADKICLTPSCIHAAAEVLSNMDVDVDPCDNFYQFTCGGFMKSAFIPINHRSVDTNFLMSQRIFELMRYSIEKPIQPNLPKPLKSLKKLYKSCMNQNVREAQGLTPLIEIFQKLGGMPVLEGNKWNRTQFNWTETVYKLHDMGFVINYLPYFHVKADPTDDTQQVIWLSVGFETNNARKTMDDKYFTYKNMIKMIEMFNATHEYATRDISDLLNFMAKLGELSETNIDVIYKSMNITDLNGYISSISWGDYMERMIPSNIDFDDSEMVTVAVPQYLKKVIELWDKTGKRVQANYMMWRTIISSGNFLNEEMYGKYFLLSNSSESEYKFDRKNSNSDLCLVIAQIGMPISFAALFVRDHLDKNAKKDISEIVTNIRNESANAMHNVDFERRTKKLLLNKIAAMTFSVSHPEELENDVILEEYYKGLEISEDNMLRNILNLNLFEEKNNFKLLRSEDDIEKNWFFRLNPSTVNAANLISPNLVDLPAGILQGPFNNIDSPKYMKYGDAGTTIGHELYHGLGTHRKIDKDGNEINQRGTSSLQTMKKIFDCFVQQCEKYTVGENGHINGIRTSEENFADNGGIKMAYQAYVKWSTDREPEQQLPNLPYTPRQMFWISYANTLCEKKKDINYVRVDPHAPNEFRVNGPLSNIKDFAIDFKCKENSYMNPSKKCDTW